MVNEEIESKLADGAKVTRLRKKIRIKLLILLLVCFLVIATALISLYLVTHGGPVPSNIKSETSFKIYYPSKLPAGYRLELNSFYVPQKNVVIYSITGNAGTLDISEQPNPGDTILKRFYANYIPLHLESSTTLGQAIIGAYRNGGTLKSIISLPINHGPWVILTAPPSVEQNVLIQILSTLHT